MFTGLSCSGFPASRPYCRTRATYVGFGILGNSEVPAKNSSISADEPCQVCHKVCLDSFGEHVVHCKELPGFKYRHDLVRYVMCDVLKRANISAKKKAPVNILTDPLEGRSTIRPVDTYMFGWEGENTCVCPYMCVPYC
ncbi:hypothetical protein R6Q59_011392 [Mikania micrantha]